MRLTVTGFGPFPRVRDNPSARLALRVAASQRWRRLGVDARGVVLPVRYTQAAEAAAQIAQEADVLLLLGVAARSKILRVEQRATRARSRISPDAARGTGMAAGKTTAADTGFALRTRAQITPLVSVLRRAGLPARTSINAGRYVCNATYRAALTPAGEALVLFVHVPLLPARYRRGKPSVPAARAVERGLADLALHLIVQRRNEMQMSKVKGRSRP